MRVCYFGTYAQENERNISIIQGLTKNNVEVIECWISENQPHFKLISLFTKFIKQKKCQAIIVGFRVNFQEVILARMLAFILSIPLVTNIFYSQYQTAVWDRKLVKPGSKKARRLWLVDKIICELSELIILDTNAHIEYFVREFNLKKKKFVRVLVGADDEIYYPRAAIPDCNKFIVHFHGTFIPLHGIEYIILAAKSLEKYHDIEFQIIGEGQTYDDVLRLANKMNCQNVIFYKMLSREKLAQKLAGASICLGIYGKTEKAQNVIPFKVFQALATGKPLITARTLAVGELLKNRQDCLMCEAGNPISLANAIIELKKDPELRRKISQNGYKLFKEKCTPEIIIQELLSYLRSVCRIK